MKIVVTFVFLIIFIFAESCFITTEKQYCFEMHDPIDGEFYCIMVILLDYSLKNVRREGGDASSAELLNAYYSGLCLQSIKDKEKCNKKSEYIPAVRGF